MIISATAVLVALLTSIVSITTISIQIFANTASAEPQLGQQLQLTTTANNTNNTTNGNNSMLISSPSSAPMNIRPNIR